MGLSPYWVASCHNSTRKASDNRSREATTLLGVLCASCAGLNRHVAGQPESVQNDPTQYYKSAPANYYAKFWHDNSVDNLAYGFPYDDDAGQSTYISHSNPQYLQVAVGW